MADDVDIAALVGTAETPRRDSGGLARLLGRCWPAASDATQPAARDWVRRWRPSQVSTQLPRCACATGRCAWCN